MFLILNVCLNMIICGSASSFLQAVLPYILCDFRRFRSFVTEKSGVFIFAVVIEFLESRNKGSINVVSCTIYIDNTTSVLALCVVC